MGIILLLIIAYEAIIKNIVAVTIIGIAYAGILGLVYLSKLRWISMLLCAVVCILCIINLPINKEINAERNKIKAEERNFVTESEKPELWAKCEAWSNGDSAAYSECITYDGSLGGGPGDSGSGSPGYHSVDGYYRSDGSYVNGYIRSNPDGNPYNNIRQ